MTKQELKAKIDKLENGIKSKATPSNLIAPLKAQKAKLEKELQDMEASEKKAVKTKKVSKVAEKIKAAKKSVAKKTPAKAPAKEERKKDNIARDGDRKSLPAGKRISKTGKVYYEMRANRTDKQTSRKPYLAKGGMVKYFDNKEEWRLSRPSGSIEKEVLEKVKYYSSSDKDFVGNFGWRTASGKLAEGYLYRLDESDKDLVKDVKLKDGEKIYRYFTRTTAVGGITPLIKVNLDKGLLYFSDTDDSDKVTFETKGTSTEWVSLIKDKMADGGETEEGVDLFEDYENIPSNVQEVLDKYSDAFEDGDYRKLEKANNELKKIGYTFEYGLDGEAYDLRKIGQKGKMDEDEYAKGGSLNNPKFFDYYQTLERWAHYRLSVEKGKDYYLPTDSTIEKILANDIMYNDGKVDKSTHDKMNTFLVQQLKDLKMNAYPEYADGGYVIFEGRDNYNDKPLYKVISKDEDNDYVGEFHDNREDAEKELKELKNKNMKYGYGGKTKSIKSMKDITIEQISSMTGVGKAGIERFSDENNLSEDDLSNIMQGLGRRMISASDFVTAVSGTKENQYTKEIVDFAKSGKGYKMADGGVTDGDQKIKDFYVDKYPMDELGIEINEKSTFDGLYKVLDNEGDVYHYIGVTDSLVRERLFDKLSQLMGVDYDVIYDKWLSSDYAKGGYMADGGKIKDQYEGKTPKEVWDNLSKAQRQHFLYDHKQGIEDYRGEEYGELTSKEIISAYNSDYEKLDKWIKNRFDNHVREGQYAKGGYMADGGMMDVVNAEISTIRRNIMGTTSFMMKIKGMRNPQDFSVYPISTDQSGQPIKIQSATRFGFLDLSSGRGLMSQSHPNGAYSYHFTADKKVPFKLSETDLQRIKEHISGTAGSSVGTMGVSSDNSGANMMASGGYMAHGGEVKSLQRSLMDKVKECEDIIDKLALLYKEDSKSREALTDSLQMLSRAGRKVIIYTNNEDLIEMSDGGYMASGGEVPAHFGSGRNIEVFGYQTENFDICGTAVKEFEAAVEIMQNAKESEKESLARCAKYVDGLFGTEKLVVENSGADDANFYESVSDIMSASIYNYRAEMSINLFSFVPQHLKEIAVRMAKAEKGGFYALGGMTAGRWYRDKSGEEFKFIGKIDSGENKGKFLFTDGQKSVYKDLEDFEGGRPKETKLFGFFEDGGSVAEGNYEMLMSNIKAIKHHAEELEGAVTPNTEIEAWVLSKSERAETDLSDITHYLDGLKMADGGKVGQNYEIELFFKGLSSDNRKIGKYVVSEKTLDNLENYLQEDWRNYISLDIIDESNKKPTSWYDLKKAVYTRYTEVFGKKAKGGYMADGGVYKNYGKHKIENYLYLKNGTKVFVKEGYYMYPSTDGVASEGIYYSVKFPNGEEKNVSVDDIVFSINAPQNYSGYEKGGIMAKGGDLSSIKEKYEENEDENAHSENVVLLAKHFGTKEDLAKAKEILALHEKEGSLSSENGKKRQELHLKLIGKARTEMGKQGIEFEKGGYMAEGGGVDEIDMEKVESAAKFYTDESRWSTKPTISKFEAEIKEIKELKRKLDNKETTPSKIIGSGYKSSLARPLAYRWLKEQLLIAERAIEMLKEKEKMAYGGMMAKGGEIAFDNSNLYLNGFGMDSNGNSVVKVSFPNQRAFSIQTNGVLKETNNLYTKNIKELTEAQIKTIEKEVVDYVKQFGSKEQKQRLKTYSGYMAKGGEFKPYGKTKGKYKIEYTEDGEKQSEVWESKEMVEDRGKRLLKLGHTNIKITELKQMAKGGIYSSDSLYILKVSKDGKEVGEERFRAKNIREAKEMGEDYEEKYKIKFGGDLSFSVKEAMADGGKVKFADKVKSVQESLLKRKKVSPKVQKDYGKTYSKAEAKESAQRIVGSRMAQLKEKMAKKKK
jgi:hypothetical protein